MGISAQFFVVTDWPYISRQQIRDGCINIIDDARDYFLDVELGVKTTVKQPQWCYEWQRESSRLRHWKAAFWAGEYYEKAVRPLIAEEKDRDSADRMFEALFWGGNEGEAQPHHDLAPTLQFHSGGEILLSFAPEKIAPVFDSLSTLVATLERMQLNASGLVSQHNSWFPSSDEWIAYLKDWRYLFRVARRMKAGLVALAC